MRRAEKFACPKATRADLARARTWDAAMPAAVALGLLDAEERDEASRILIQRAVALKGSLAVHVVGCRAGKG